MVFSPDIATTCIYTLSLKIPTWLIRSHKSKTDRQNNDQKKIQTKCR